MEITYILDKREGKIVPHKWKSLISESLISEVRPCLDIQWNLTRNLAWNIDRKPIAEVAIIYCASVWAVQYRWRMCRPLHILSTACQLLLILRFFGHRPQHCDRLPTRIPPPLLSADLICVSIRFPCVYVFFKPTIKFMVYFSHQPGSFPLENKNRERCPARAGE